MAMGDEMDRGLMESSTVDRLLRLEMRNTRCSEIMSKLLPVHLKALPRETNGYVVSWPRSTNKCSL